MRTRQSITELFTTFLQLDADRVIGWAVDAKLRRNLLKCQASLSQPEHSENFWISYWYKLWQNQPEGLAREHFSAYLQETCYWSADKIISNLSATQYTVSDCFQMVITRVDKILKGFKPNMGFNLNNYASTIFSNEIKEMLRSRNEIDISTNWRLLRKLTQKRLVESLQNVGLSAETIQRYVLAWKCYQAIYAPQHPTGTRQLSKPDESTWMAIAQLYNSERHTQLSPPGPECDGQTMEKWLVASAKAVRDYFYPSMASLNASRNDDDSGEYQDILPQLKQDSLMTEIIAQEELQERKSQQSLISNVLIAALNELDEEAKKIIELYYSQDLTQQQIAKQLGIKQYTISRRLSKAKDSLILKLANWSKESLHISLNSLLLNYISTVLEEWLKAYYHPSSS
ncbi:sigma-70 family RNA polymerase sigma factor [Calothrix sp. FACHB-1219]|uniref:sigma-70 family RNA polymerase sigma factor n=1 Tax=unclassified Calothrix TaxID=2619626 RepID=UPI001689DA7D|nr:MULTISPECIES: sigma-70 family RNA polymerase sigma factor [unclassified Calothrix]MBD2202658.1 sigma-70 family RNA polymerase sigma factor [Calothrix sp. FACHB-168]MBD2218811.1 sigma-70 family RNA polymerase sigma factor [Calothrix sp. FACHB-1219]